MIAGDGVVSAEARAAFERALKARSAAQVTARFYPALAAEQDGDREGARSRYADDPRRLAAGRAVGRRCGSAWPRCPAARRRPGVAALPAQDREAAIRGMVEGLAARLGIRRRQPRRMAAPDPLLYRARRAPTARPRRSARRARRWRRTRPPPSGSTRWPATSASRSPRTGHDAQAAPARPDRDRPSACSGSRSASCSTPCATRSCSSMPRATSPAKGVQPGTRFRLGGLVKEGSVKRGENQQVTFEVADARSGLPVRYRASCRTCSAKGRASSPRACWRPPALPGRHGARAARRDLHAARGRRRAEEAGRLAGRHAEAGAAVREGEGVLVEAGHFALALALGLSLVQSPCRSGARGRTIPC